MESRKGWEKVNIGDVAQVSSSKRIFAKEYVEKGVPFYRSKEIIEKSNNEDISQKLFISFERFNEIKTKYGVPGFGDILLTSVGTLGVPYLVKDEEFYFKDGNLTWFYNFSRIDSKFLYYWFLSPYSKYQIYSKQIGSTQKALTISNLKRFEILLPPIIEQEIIVSILSALDQKIEANNKIISNLESQAQAIFKSWFVDFEPFQDGEFVESELGMIPKGWAVRTIKEMSEDIITGKTPPTKFEENFGNYMPFIKIPDMHDKVYVINTEVSLSMEGMMTQKNKTLPKNSICVSCIATVGLVNLVFENSQTNQQINSIIAKKEISPYYIYCYMKTLFDYLNAIGSSGSTTKNINKVTFSKIKIINPVKEIMVKFDGVSNTLFENIRNLQIQNQKLAQTRDTLLPKLMSGEIDVSNIKIDIEEDNND